MSFCKIPKKAFGHPHKNIENDDYKRNHMPHHIARAGVQHNPKDALTPIHNITKHQILKKTRIKDREYTNPHNYLPEPFQKKE